MAKPDNLLTGKHPERGLLWVSFDASVHHITGRVAETRFGARLAPFASREEAEAALVAAGAVFDRADNG